MSRLQLALNVADLGESITFYSEFFGTGPSKVRDGYANFQIADPPLKLVLFEVPEAAGQLNHLGVEVDSTDEVANWTTRLQAHGHTTDVREQELCCHAVQDKVWVTGADQRWEVYTVLGDDPASTGKELPLLQG